MSRRWTAGFALLTAIAICLVGLSAAPAGAAPTSGQTSEDRAALARVLDRYEAAQARSAQVDARVRKASAALDRIVADEARYQSRLRSRVAAIYRSPDESAIILLFTASSVQDLSERFDILERIAQQDADNLKALKAARAEAKQSAAELLKLQADEARALDALADEVARARKELAASEATLREYEARTAANAKAARAKTDSTRNLSGTGAWKTAVASHYGRNFTGRGASGEAIGPYSMIVAHKTLPFGTLIEFEYNGKRAVARVADRGPYVAGRTFDLGPGVVRVLDFSGVHEVRYRIISQ
ncbi:MAG: RlpA-like double-psi beta-barrel domain-containing protein [Coriobacteriia bacterium]